MFVLRRTFASAKPQRLREELLSLNRQVPRSRAQRMQSKIANKPEELHHVSRREQPLRMGNQQATPEKRFQMETCRANGRGDPKLDSKLSPSLVKRLPAK